MKEFESMLPVILRSVTYALRYHEPRQEREELNAEAIAFAYCSYCDAAENGKTVYASALGRYGAKRAPAGRRAAGYTTRSIGAHVDRVGGNEWLETIVTDKANPADVAGFRIDFEGFYNGLTDRQQKIIDRLSVGNTTRETASAIGVTDGAISQARRAIAELWDNFTQEKEKGWRYEHNDTTIVIHSEVATMPNYV